MVVVNDKYQIFNIILLTTEQFVSKIIEYSFKFVIVANSEKRRILEISIWNIFRKMIEKKQNALKIDDIINRLWKSHLHIRSPFPLLES